MKICACERKKSAKSKFVSTVELLFCVFLAWCWLLSCLYVFQRSLQYHPDETAPYHPSRYGLKDVQTVQFTTSDNLVLNSWYIPAAAEDNPTILLFHGNAGNIGNRAIKAKFYHDSGIGILLVGYRGYGGNAGKPTEQGFYRDGHAAYKFLHETKQIPANKIVIYGESLGSGVATEMMTHYDAAALVLEGAFISAASVAKYVYPFVPVDLLLKDRFDNIQKINDINGPLLMLHGSEDDVLPYWQGADLYNAAPSPKAFVRVEGGGHVDLYDFDITGESILRFLKEHSILKYDSDESAETIAPEKD